jgi:hypothetical protein
MVLTSTAPDGFFGKIYVVPPHSRATLVSKSISRKKGFSVGVGDTISWFTVTVTEI